MQIAQSLLPDRQGHKSSLLYKMEEHALREAAPKPSHRRKQSIDDYCNFLLQQEAKSTKGVAHLTFPVVTVVKPTSNPDSVSK